MWKLIWSNTDIDVEIPTEEQPTEEEYREAQIRLEEIKKKFAEKVKVAFLAFDKKLKDEKEKEQAGQLSQLPTD